MSALPYFEVKVRPTKAFSQDEIQVAALDFNTVLELLDGIGVPDENIVSITRTGFLCPDLGDEIGAQ